MVITDRDPRLFLVASRLGLSVVQGTFSCWSGNRSQTLHDNGRSTAACCLHSLVARESSLPKHRIAIADLYIPRTVRVERGPTNQGTPNKHGCRSSIFREASFEPIRSHDLRQVILLIDSLILSNGRVPDKSSYLSSPR